MKKLSTYLKDRNGRKIFAGDRVQYERHTGYMMSDFVGTVIFDYNYAAFGIEIPGRCCPLHFTDIHDLNDLMNGGYADMKEFAPAAIGGYWLRFFYKREIFNYEIVRAKV